MSLADVYAKQNILNSHLVMHQSIYEAGLYDEVGDSVDGYLKTLEQEEQIVLLENMNKSEWRFNRSEGDLETTTDFTDGSSPKPKDDYWIPVHDKSFISLDQLTIVIEGTALKSRLPEVRPESGSTIPFRFLIVDFDLDLQGYFLR